MATALLFDRDRVDELEDWWGQLPRLGRSSILWIDLERPNEEEIRRLTTDLELAPESAERLADAGRVPSFSDFGSYLHVTAYAPSDAQERALQRVGCLVAERWIVTVHDAPLEVLETVRERASGSGETGHLDGPEFLANILDWVLHSYLTAFEEIERSLEEIDAMAMQGELSREERALARLVDLRREIGGLRRALTSHREPLLALTRPELEAIASSESAERFAELRAQLEEAVQAARDCRDAVVGSFDLIIASTGERTNEIMKVLTLASVLLLPGALVAGVLGMNFHLSIFEDVIYFWVAVGAIVAIAAATLLVARMRHWI